MAEPSIWLTLLMAALATYSWRWLGVLVAGSIDPNGPVFEWVGCVAYALLAGLTARMILLPIGPLQTTDLGCRLIALALAVLVLRRFSANIALAVLTGIATLMVLSAIDLRFV